MNGLISDAMAQAAPAQTGGDPMTSVLFFVGMIAIFYFLLIRPQTKRAKEHKKLIDALGKGDEVITNGGLLGKITDVGEQYVDVEVANNVTVKLQRQAIATVLPKGSIKAAQKD